MSTLSTFTNPAPYHILSYGALLGTSLYQSFVNGIVSYRALPRAQFSTLQATLTPIYFGIQTVLPVLIALTYPGAKSLTGAHSPSGFFGVLEEQNRYTVLAPVVGMFVTGAVNWGVLGPATTRVMWERKERGKKEGKMYYEPGEHSVEMQRLSRTFSRLHGVNALINLIGVGFMVWYGALLAERLV